MPSNSVDGVPVRQRLRTRIEGFATSIDALASRLGHRVDIYLAWPLTYAVFVGGSAFTIRHMSWVPLLDTNKVPEKASIQMAIWSVVALGLYSLLQLAVLLITRLVRGDSGGIRTVAEVNRRLVPLLAVPPLLTLSLPTIERDSWRETAALILLSAALVGIGVYAWARPRKAEGPVEVGVPGSVPDAPRRSWPSLGFAKAGAGLAVLSLWAAYGWFFSRLSLTNHHAINTRTTDLGYYDNIFYQSAHGRPLGCSFLRTGNHGAAHFDPILVLLSPIYRLYSHAEFLLVLQAVWLGAGVVPVYLIAREKLDSRVGAVVLAAMFALYPALHGANMYEFHSLSLLTSIVLCALYFLEREAYKRYAVCFALALLCREDAAIVMCLVGFYAILRGGRRYLRAGWITIGTSLVYFAIVKRFFMTSIDPLNSGPNSNSFGYYFDALIPNHNSIGGLIATFSTNPVFVLRTAVAEPKIQFLVAIFLPVLFLPFFARAGRVMLAWGLFFCLLASRGPVFSIHFQYTSLLTPFVFALTPIALHQLKDADLVRRIGVDGQRLWKGLLGAAFVATLLMSWKYGGIVENETFHGGFTRVARTLTDKQEEQYRWMRAESDKIPKDARVGTTNRVGAYVSNRKGAFFYPEHQDVDFLFVDENEVSAAEMERLKKEVEFVLVTRRKKIGVYKRR